MACWAHSSVPEEEAHAFSSSLSPKDEVCAQPSSQIAKEEAHTSLPPHPYNPRGWGARVFLLLVPEGGGVLAAILLGDKGGGAHLHAPPSVQSITAISSNWPRDLAKTKFGQRFPSDSRRPRLVHSREWTLRLTRDFFAITTDN